MVEQELKTLRFVLVGGLLAPPGLLSLIWLDRVIPILSFRDAQSLLQGCLMASAVSVVLGVLVLGARLLARLSDAPAPLRAEWGRVARLAFLNLISPSWLLVLYVLTLGGP